MKNQGCFLLLLALAGKANAISAQTPAVQVQVHDYTGLNPAVLRQFVARTEEILASSGVSLEVDACARGAELCESHAGRSRQLTIRLVADTGKRLKNTRWDTLGQSIAGPDFGTYATVFLKPVEEMASEEKISRTIVLAYAAAHEIGHLLLGNQAHTRRGLMKANWGPDEYQAMAQNRFHFTLEQTRELTSRYGSLDQAYGDAGAAIARRR
jgi:hypothetical protein